jgi:enamine deaminase RidA (YjgF/YER057c/UK114 family)
MHWTDRSRSPTLMPKEAITMTIERHLITNDPNNKPIISRAVAHGDRVYICGITGGPDGDITAQTKLALERIDQLLERAGTDKSRALTAQVWLSDIRLFRQHNLAWNEWVDPQNPPVRACVQAELTAPGLLVEIMLTAAR